jgi:transcriptional regulator with XRE-family HTH domain
MTNTELVCTQCGGSVRAKAGPGRTHEFRPGITLPIPNDLLINTCEECGETYLIDSEADQLEQRLHESYAAYCKELIEVTRERAGVTLRELERAAGVTPTYFSHITSGRKQPSLTLVRLLQAFAVHPQEIHRHLEGQDWKRAYRQQETKPLFVGTYVAALSSVHSKNVIPSMPTQGAAYVSMRSYSVSEKSPLDSLPPPPSSAEAA